MSAKLDIPAPLLEAVWADPASDAPRAVLADWLIARGSALGELIQLQLARASGKKGTQAKEKRAFDPLAWPFHPIQAICGAVDFEATERGFPATLRPPLPVSEADLKKEIAKWAPHIGHPGWATVRHIRLGIVDLPLVGELVRRSRMPLLESLEGVGPRALAALGDAPLPLRRLEVYGAIPKTTPALPIPGLEELTWFCDRRAADLPRLTEAARLVERLGVGGSLRRLVLGGFGFEAHAADTLALLAALPAPLERVEVLGDDVNRVIAERGGKLGWVLNAWSVDACVEELATLPADLSVRVAFHASGYFTKKTRPVLAERVRAACARFRAVELAVD